MRYSVSEMLEEQKATKVYILTSPDNLERFLFYTYITPASSKPSHLIRRQIYVGGRWRSTRDWTGIELSLQPFASGKHVRKERGNLKYLEYVDKGYIKSQTTLDKISG